MSDYNDQHIDLYMGLKSLSESAFPKMCANCGMVFHSVADFIDYSKSLGVGTGLKESFDEDDIPIVELFRNCSCGSTLMDFFSDRRDVSEQGRKRREIFDKMLQFLEKKGLPHEEGRIELQKILRGERSEIIEKFGIGLKNI